MMSGRALAREETGATPLLESARVRGEIRAGRLTGTSRGLALGFVQCNLVVLPRDLAYPFLLYCQRNPRGCPVLEVTDPGDPEPRRLALGADLRTDLARYRVFRDGQAVEDRADIRDLWRDDLVGFLIGSGITFDEALERAGVPTARDRWVVRTTLPTEEAAPFSGPLVATMRLLTPEQAIVATQVSARFPSNHGAPIHLGDPAAIGANLAAPLFGGPIPADFGGHIPVFWACGVTPQAAAEAARIPLMIAHAPAHGFITDLKADLICLP